MIGNLDIRQIGDPILQHPTNTADYHDHNMLQYYLSIMSSASNKYGGVGISCNQCKNITAPVAISVIGTNDPKARAAAQKRYPGEEIPYATPVINLEIISYGNENYYPTYGEGCLSVYGSLRGKVKRYRSIMVRYRDVDGNAVDKQYTGFAAHIMQHEYDHLLGVVFLQKIFTDCTQTQISVISDIVEQEIHNRRNMNNAASNVKDINSEPILVFDRDGDSVIFDNQELRIALTSLNNDTLLGIKTILSKVSI